MPPPTTMARVCLGNLLISISVDAVFATADGVRADQCCVLVAGLEGSPLRGKALQVLVGVLDKIKINSRVNFRHHAPQTLT